ncbi:MAG: beta-N-acetylhexosaminidase [Chitinophagaceae bacterium]|nr:beta-N-acetylhexosaminidase [Chitinophagaceae bacterium]
MSNSKGLLSCFAEAGIFLFFLLYAFCSKAQETKPESVGIHIIPYPKHVSLSGNDFIFGNEMTIAIDKNASEKDRFAADELKRQLKTAWGIEAGITALPSGKSIILTRNNARKINKPEGYRLKTSENTITITGADEAGLFYGIQTLIQLVQKRDGDRYVRGMEVLDWPDTKQRAIHYDTKHHQDKRSYVESLIRDLAKYKINMLVWEWEDKFACPSRPEIGAPGAFEMREIQELTAYARKYHIQLVPLVQGLGHVSFILKWPQFGHLREIYASNFEFCPLKDGSYKLLFDLWEDAVKATPGSSYFHIGSDETYELGQCPDCKKKAAEIGNNGLYHLFISKAAAHLQKLGRKVMVWESPMNWKQQDKTQPQVQPRKGLVLTESYSFETPDLKYAREAKSLGYQVFAYDPNPGIEPLFLPYFYKQDKDGKHIMGSLEDSYLFLTGVMGKDVFDGMIRTSWDDSGLPVQAWMLQFVAAAAYSWNASAPGLDEFTSAFFKNYFGEKEKDMQKLFLLLNEGAYYYAETLERNVWHFGAIGKTHLPDLPRGDILEYDPYWNIEYAEQVRKAKIFLDKMNEAIAIGQHNINAGAMHAHDIDIFVSIAGLIKHTALTYLDLSRLENAIAKAHEQRFLSHDSAYYYLDYARQIVAGNIERREKIYSEMTALWEQTMLPKGLSTPEKKYFFRGDRTRHFANRTPDLKYLIIDEEDLDLESYLKKLQEYMETYRKTFMNEDGESLNTNWLYPR